MLESNQKKTKSLGRGKKMEINKVEEKESQNGEGILTSCVFFQDGLMLSVTGGIPRWKTFS